MDQQKTAPHLYPALVWIASAISLGIYCTLGLLDARIPGVERLVEFLATADGTYIYVAAAAAIFIEGLYFVGSFFPGSTLVVIVAVLSQASGPLVFAGTIGIIFVSWCLAGAINIALAKFYHIKVAKVERDELYRVKDRFLVTWFPAFRANYEVAQIAAGARARHVLLSSVRVKLLASIAAACGTLAISFFVDIHELSDEEGFASVAAVALISLGVGIVKLRQYAAHR